MQKIRNIFYLLVPIAITLLICSFSVSICSKSYTEFIQSILLSIQRPDIELKIRTLYFPESKFQILKIVLVSASILSSIALVLLIAFRKRYYDFVSNYITKVLLFVTWVYSLYTGYSKPGKIFLWIGIIVLLIRSLWYAQNFSIQFDEAWNYNLFLSKNLFYSLGAYNNYPLHNVITWFFIQCFGNEVMVLRFPSVLIGLILIFTVALLVRSITKNECLSISLAFLIACLPIHVFYMMYARGVLFEIYFSLLISYVLLKTNHDGFTKKYLQWFGILNALGTFSMLSHVYFIGASSLFIMASGFVTKKSNLFFAFSYFMVSICCSVLLLIPILLGTGLQAGMQAAHSSQTIHWRDYLNNINEYSSFITGISWGLYFLLGLMLLMFVKEGKRLLIPFLFTLSIASIMFIIPAVTHVFPPPRAFGFLVLIPIIVFGLSLYFVYIKSKWIAMLSTIVMAAFFSERAHTHPFLNWSKQLDKEVEHVSEVMIENNIHAAFNDCRDFDYFIPGISYYYMQSHENIQFTSSAKNSTRHTDSIPSNTEAIIVSKMSNQKPSKDFSLLYSIGDVLIYKRNN